MLEEQELGRGQDLRSSVARDKVLGSQAADLSAAHRLHFAEEGILLAFLAEEEEAAVAVREVPWAGVPGAREACGCSVALTSEASAVWGAADLSDTGRADFGIGEVGPGTVAVSAQRGTVQMELRLEETALVEMSEEGGTSLVWEGVAAGTVPGHNQAGSRAEGQRMQKRRAAGMGGGVGEVAAVTLGTLAEARVESVPSKKMGGSFEVEGAAKPWR